MFYFTHQYQCAGTIEYLISSETSCINLHVYLIGMIYIYIGYIYIYIVNLFLDMTSNIEFINHDFHLCAILTYIMCAKLAFNKF